MAPPRVRQGLIHSVKTQLMKSPGLSDGCLCVQEMECEASGPSVSRTHPPPTQDEEDGWTVVRKKK